MESAMLASPRPLLRASPFPPALARTALPRIAPSTITSIVMEDLRSKNMACSGIGATSASRIIAQWVAWRRQACEQMLLDLDGRAQDPEILALASLQAVSTMLDSSFLRALAASEDHDGSRRRALVRQIAREGTATVPQQSSPLGGGRKERASQHASDAQTRNPPRLCGWQARTHAMKRELQALSEHRAVSAFVHRGCIESFLRGRFYFCGGWPTHDEGSDSMATTESGQLIQSHPVTTDEQQTNSSMSLGAQISDADSDHQSVTHQGLGDLEIHTFQPTGDQSFNALQSTIPNSHDALQDDMDQEQMSREYPDSVSPEQGSEQYGSSFSTLSDNVVVGTYGQQNEGEDNASFDDGDDDEWHAIDSHEAADPRRREPDQSFFRPTYNNWFGHPVDSFHGVELPDLLIRRTVSNLLSSGFGESLDQLLTQSYAQRQELAARQMPNAAASDNEDHAEQVIHEPNQAEHGYTTGEPSFVFTGEGRQRRKWHWTRPEFVIDAIEELHVDMIVLYRGMTSMQRELRACMEMQIELQRSIKQEVSAALNRPMHVQWWAERQLDESHCHLVRKGTCCVCCENKIDALLYRCGHMCTCSKCARELLNGVGKCPMCRAPIVEVVRAYSP